MYTYVTGSVGSYETWHNRSSRSSIILFRPGLARSVGQFCQPFSDLHPIGTEGTGRMDAVYWSFLFVILHAVDSVVLCFARQRYTEKRHHCKIDCYRSARASFGSCSVFFTTLTVSLIQGNQKHRHTLSASVSVAWVSLPHGDFVQPGVGNCRSMTQILVKVA